MVKSSKTLQEIANEAGVSVATVSYVLNGKGRMSNEIRRKVSRMLQENGIRPRIKRRRILYISDMRLFQNLSMAAPFMAKFQGLSDGLADRELSLDLHFFDTSQDVNAATMDKLLSLRPGLVVLDSDLHEHLPAIADWLERESIPCIQIGHTVRAKGYDAVVLDDFEGARLATQHLIAAGHQRIGTLRWNTDGDPASTSKHAGYLTSLAEAGLDADPELIIEAPFKRTHENLTGRTALKQLMELSDPPTGIFVENSFISASLVHPHSLEDHEFAEMVQPLDIVHFEALDLDIIEQVMAGMLMFEPRQIKVLRVDWRDVGAVAAERVVHRLENPTAPSTIVKVAGRLYRLEGMDKTAI